MKLFIQIPCLNEETTLPLVLESIPKQIDGVDEIEILIIDDGSKDRTVEVAKSYGVKHFVRHTRNMGLARSFHDGVDYALRHGADILVNTDGDNQYPQAKIAELVQPVLEGVAEIVVADRQTSKIAHFSPFKKLMQRFGSWVVNKAAGTNLPDAASGFRAYSKYSLMKLNVVTQFSYCMETIIQAGNKRLAITSIPIETNPKTRESRLFSNMFQHMWESGLAILRAYLMFKPYSIFASIGAILGVGGLIPFIFFLVFVSEGQSNGHIQSLLAGVVLLLGSLLSFVIGIVADLTRLNRIIQEDAIELQKRHEYGAPKSARELAAEAADAADPDSAVKPTRSTRAA